ncbi:hypothetical protein GOBAR_AA38772 [Gossypium barbadense]|uniref:Uncharacterized protein n=1 Tax=Gossypium barbadense TaxID=3634 RepID=A0A2P5VT18_GOSBA|nr:hypothetical protein GOBAR_AA38772 [Gossypium barbadense]
MTIPGDLCNVSNVHQGTSMMIEPTKCHEVTTAFKVIFRLEERIHTESDVPTQQIRQQGLRQGLDLDKIEGKGPAMPSDWMARLGGHPTYSKSISLRCPYWDDRTFYLAEAIV